MGSITNSLTMCSGQGMVLQGKGKEKDCVAEDIRYNPHNLNNLWVFNVQEYQWRQIVIKANKQKYLWVFNSSCLTSLI